MEIFFLVSFFLMISSLQRSRWTLLHLLQPPGAGTVAGLVLWGAPKQAAPCVEAGRVALSSFCGLPPGGSWEGP